ncbi:outer membrane protein [Shewanella sp. NFH-SH190041]|uniref:hypothetical protein n=1 Tax=Shewanella sp. NFH-SH190041 TaxID=2950245 RepID=UPI0021C3860F|nr:hypothetical protein [Shewanella sp. NFH-SH190041]BDM65453.1 outer membrane protein [Shewanella sp. NFH-SH190041]
MTAYADQQPKAVNYAFANYLESGIYRSSEHTAAVASIPLSFNLKKGDDYSVALRLPVSLGFFNYSWEQLPALDFPQSLGTLTVTPGIAYKRQLSPRWKMESYLDLGFGHNFSDNTNVGILSVGLSGLYSFDIPRYTPIWVNRFYSAGYRNMHSGRTDYFSAFKTGIESGLGMGFHAFNRRIDPKVFTAVHWFFSQEQHSKRMFHTLLHDSTIETGFSLAFSRPVGIGPIAFDHLGVSYSRVDHDDIWRLFFSFAL